MHMAYHGMTVEYDDEFRPMKTATLCTEGDFEVYFFRGLIDSNFLIMQVEHPTKPSVNVMLDTKDIENMIKVLENFKKQMEEV